MALPAFLSNPMALSAGAGLLGAGLSSFGGGGQGWQKRYGKQQARNLRNASADVADNFFSPYTQQRFAGTQPIFQGAFNSLQGVDPMAFINQGAGILSDMPSYMPYSPQQVTAGNVTAGNISAMDPSQINAMTSQFMNPYTDQVLDRARAGIERRMGAQRAADASRMAGLGAFGSSGQALTDAATTEGFQRILADTEARLRDRGFQQAQQAAMSRAGAQEAIQGQNVANQLAAMTGNRNAALQAMLANQGAGLSAAGLNLQGRGQDMDRARLMAGIGQNLFNPMMQFGQVQQGIAQQQPDFNFQEFMRQQNYDTNKLAALSGGNPLMNFAGGPQSNPWLRGLSSGIGFGSQVYDFLKPKE